MQPVGGDDGRVAFMSVDFREVPLQLRNTAISGHILKQGQKFKSWRRRFFVLEGNFVYPWLYLSNFDSTRWGTEVLSS